MQRLLVALSLVLLLGTVYLGFSLSDLSARVERERLERAREAMEAEREGPEADEAEPRKVALLESRLRDSREEVAGLRRSVNRLESRIGELSRQLARAPNAPDDPDPSGPTAPDAGYAADAPGIARDGEGNFVIGEEEMAYFRAVQAKIDRQRRIDGQTRNYLRRIQSLVDRNEVPDVSEEKMQQIETVLRRFVTDNDDLVTRYIREPTEQVKGLGEDEKRTELSAQREKFGAEARRALGEILPPEDVAKIAERVFTNPWGLRPRGFNR